MNYRSIHPPVKGTNTFLWCCIIVWLAAVPSQCHVDNYLEATICDGESQYLHCPQTKDIHILQTFYGKWRNHDCHGPLAVKDEVPTCHVERPKSTAIVRDICQGKNNCKLFADKTIFGDPCSQLSKYLYVTYFCLPSHSKTKGAKAKEAASALSNVSPGDVRGFLRQKIEKDLAMHSAKLCNGESRTLACKPGQRIKVNNAFYGKKNGHDCHGELPYKDESPTCSALDAKYNVQRFCEGRRFCLVHARDATYGRSLCPNINKYLQLTYFCEDPPASNARSSVDVPQTDYEEDAVTRSRINGNDDVIRIIRICNGHRKTIGCKSKTKTMVIHEAFYGKRNGQDCRGPITYRDNVPDCLKNTAFDSVHYLCNGRQSCDLAAEHALFGEDPCPGTNKYLEVKYSC